MYNLKLCCILLLLNGYYNLSGEIYILKNMLGNTLNLTPKYSFMTTGVNENVSSKICNLTYSTL